MKTGLLAIMRNRCLLMQTTTTLALTEFNLWSLCCLPSQMKTQITLQYLGVCLPCMSKNISLVSTEVII